MLLAIYGAILGIDRMLGSFFDVIVVLLPAVLINIYAALHTYSDGVYFSIGIAFLTFIISGAEIVYLTYVPVSIVTGLVYSYGVKHDYSSTKLLLISVISFILGEFLISFIILPLLKQPTVLSLSNPEEINSLLDEANNMLKGIGINGEDSLKVIKSDPNKYIRTTFIIMMVVIGFFEGVIIHLLTGFLYIKFKIVDIKKTNILLKKPNKIIAYASMLCVAAFYFAARFLDFTKYFYLMTILTFPFMFAVIYLWFYGYIFVLLYIRVRLGFNISPLLIIILILIFSGLFIICGFLYAAGPFQSLVMVNNNENQQ